MIGVVNGFHKNDHVLNFQCRAATVRPLLEKKRDLEQSLFSLHPEAHGKLERIKLETETVSAEIKRRYSGYWLLVMLMHLFCDSNTT